MVCNNLTRSWIYPLYEPFLTEQAGASRLEALPLEVKLIIWGMLVPQKKDITIQDGYYYDWNHYVNPDRRSINIGM